MIISLKIKHLFGRFNYEFYTKAGGVTIITGPNGYGKSTILQIIDAISNKNLVFLRNLEFSSIECAFDNEQIVKIEKTDDGLAFNGKTLSLGVLKKIDFPSRRYQYARRIGPTEWRDARTGEVISLDEARLSSFGDGSFMEFIKFGELEGSEKNSIIELNELINNISSWSGKTRLISDQRLFKRIYDHRRDEEDLAEAILELPKALKEKISNVSSDYSAQANRLDSTYPSRLLKSTPSDEISEEEYKNRLKEAQGKFIKLQEYALAELPLLEEGAFDLKYATALKIYFDDFFSKFNVFENLIVKLDLFTSIINGRLKFKQIEISREEGFIVKNQSTGDGSLLISKLSSGEKQEILLFFDLIFNTNNDLLLLIDEPELSLHVSWQQKFLDDLLKVIQINNLQVIIATHSPQIIGSHGDIQVDLGELYNEQ